MPEDLTPKIGGSGTANLPPPVGAQAQPDAPVGFTLLPPSAMLAALRIELEATGIPWFTVSSRVEGFIGKLYAKGYFLAQAYGANTQVVQQELVQADVKLNVPVRLRAQPNGGVKPERA